MSEARCSPSRPPPRGEGGEPTSSADPLHLLRARLANGLPACALRWTGSTGSTNADLLHAAKAGLLDGPTLLAAGRQTAGRGRQGRAWQDDAQTSVLCSLAWPFPTRHDIGPLSLAVGVWLTQALHALGAEPVRLKWPNDLLLPAPQGNAGAPQVSLPPSGGEHSSTPGAWRKLGGVLVEVADTPQARWAIIGFGLNLRTPTGQPGAAGLDMAGVQIDRAEALAALVPALLAGLRSSVTEGLAPALAQWNTLHAWAGQPVSVQDRGQTLFTGIALGIAPDGALGVQTAQGNRQVRSADVSLRLDGAATT